MTYRIQVIAHIRVKAKESHQFQQNLKEIIRKMLSKTATLMTCRTQVMVNHCAQDRKSQKFQENPEEIIGKMVPQNGNNNAGGTEAIAYY